MYPFSFRVIFNNYKAITLALFFVLGIASSSLIILPFWIPVILTFLFFISLFLKTHIHQGTIILLGILGIVTIGNVYYSYSVNQNILLPDNIKIEKNVKVWGRIENIELFTKDVVKLTVLLDTFKTSNHLFTDVRLYINIKLDDKHKLENIYANINPYDSFYALGEYRKGRAKRNPGEFDYNKYLHLNGISGVFYVNDYNNFKIISKSDKSIASYFHVVRKSVAEVIELVYSEKSRGLIKGLLLADRREVDEETKEEFINSGVFHILAVSGLHVSSIAFIILLLFGRFNIYIKNILVILALFFFLLLTGSPPSVSRAVLMALLICLTFLTGRDTSLLNSISVAAIILLVLNPSDLFHPGFQLSFAAVISIALSFPVSQRFINHYKLSDKKILKYFVQYFFVSAAIQMGTLPLTVIYFSKISLIALVMNFLIIPFVGIVLSLSIFTIILAFFSLSAALIWGLVNEYLISTLLNLIHYSSNLKFSHIKETFNINNVLLFYFFSLIIYISLIKHSNKRVIVSIFILSIANYFLFSSFTSSNSSFYEKNSFNICMVDVGQGDAFLLKFPDGTTGLIDAGNCNYYYDAGEKVIAPLLDHLKIDKVDYAFISHLDIDHYGGIVSLIKKNKVKTIVKPPSDNSEQDLKLENFLRAEKISFSYFRTGISEIGGVKLYTLSDSISFNFTQSNDRSSLLKFVYGDISILFTGDIGKNAEKYFIFKYGNFLKSNILKVAHHGSNTGSSREFLDFVHPDLSLISAGYGNRFNHPAPEVIQRLKDHNIDIYRTDTESFIMLTTYGKNIKISDWN
jgi:competence protein ComEC